MRSMDLPVHAGDGHRFNLLVRIPVRPTRAVLWLPALGVAARHYLPFAECLAACGVAVFLHEWRGHGSSNLRAGGDCDWGYRELLTLDLPASGTAMQHAVPIASASQVVGGHSLGGQLASCHVALTPADGRQLWLVASGAPYWRAFPPPARYWLPMAYRFLPWLARRNGALPGRRIGFGGNEARGVIGDWAGTALSGRYAAPGVDIDLEAALARYDGRIRAATLADDWLAPASSLRFLLDKMPMASSHVTRLDRTSLGVRSDHFAWMERPAAVTEALLAPDNT
jgi:predicted alpha/beta hydrolase